MELMVKFEDYYCPFAVYPVSDYIITYYYNYKLQPYNYAINIIPYNNIVCFIMHVY